MKNKTKLMLALSILTAGTLAAGATGTFAWFTTNKTATATYNNITVNGTTGDLSVNIAGVTDAATVDNSKKTEVTASGTTSATSDVSSNDGLKFVQPDWKSVQGNEQEVNSLKTVTSLNGYFTQYSITVSNNTTDTSSNAIDVYLSALKITVSKAEASDATLTSIASWVRVAVTSKVKNPAENKRLEAETGSETFIFQNDITTASSKKYVSGVDAQNKLILTDVGNSLKGAGDSFTNVEPKAWKAKAAQESVTLGVSVWIEGTMNDNQDDAKGATISVSMTFSSKDTANA